MKMCQRCFLAVALIAAVFVALGTTAASSRGSRRPLPVLVGESPPRGGMYTTIVLRRATADPFAALKRLKAGKYRIYIRVRLPDHNFHLIGPGVDKKTKLGFVGQLTWIISFRPGVYHYQADTHLPRMRGSFTVY